MRINLNAKVDTVAEGLAVLRQAEEGAKDESSKESLKELIKLCEEAMTSASASAEQSTVYQLLIKVGISLE